MACIARFEPTGIDIRDDGASERVGLRFENGEDYYEVILRRDALAAIFDHILVTTRSAPLKEAQAEDLSGVLVLEGHDTRKVLDEGGGVELRMHLRTDDGMRSLTWKMTSEGARQLASELNQWAS